MKKIVLWITIIVMFLMLSAGLCADNSPPGITSLEECVLDLPSQLSPQLAVIGNDFYLTQGLDQTICNLDTNRSNLVEEFLIVNLDTSKVNVIDKAIRYNMRQHLDIVNYIRPIGNVNRLHFDFG